MCVDWFLNAHQPIWSNDKMFQSVIKMSSKAELNQKTPCILEIGDKGIKMIDKSKPGVGFYKYSATLNVSLRLYCVRTVEFHHMNISSAWRTWRSATSTPETTDTSGSSRRYQSRYWKEIIWLIFLSTRLPVYRSTPAMCLSASPPPDVLLRHTGGSVGRRFLKSF